MPQSTNSDTDGTIAGLAGVPVHYRVFADTSLIPPRAPPLAAPLFPTLGDVESDQTSGQQAAFPLLAAALPEFAHYRSLPSGSDRNAVAIPVVHRAVAGSPDRVVHPLPGPTPNRDLGWVPPRSTIPAPARQLMPIALPASQQTRADEHPASQTPLQAVFARLHGTAPSPVEPACPRSKLQTMFGAL